VVDDEPTVSASIKMMLEHYGHEAMTVDNGEAAMALCKTEQFDLIITDYSMPDMKGDELSEKIKCERPGQKILMVSAFGHEVLGHGKPTSEPDAVLTKPFSVDALIMAVTELVG
jgi:CheY-like chemotaxis protein